MIYLVIFTFLGFMLGYFISNKYKYRYITYLSSKEFFLFYKLKISFAQEKLVEIISSYNFDKRLKDFSNELIFYYKNKNIIFDKNNLKLNYLKDNDREELVNYYTSLGKLGKEEEIEKVCNIINNIEKKENEYYLDYKKYSIIYLKLFTILGAVIGLLLL